jgi:hypothetical protein
MDSIHVSVIDWSGTDGISDTPYRVGELDNFRLHGLSIQLPQGEVEDVSYFCLYRGQSSGVRHLVWCAPHGPWNSRENYFALANGSFILIKDGLYVTATTDNLIKNSSMSVFYT